MIKNNRLNFSIVKVCVCGIFVVSCGAVNEVQTTEIAITKPSKQQPVTPELEPSGDLCGDGVCDQVEQSKPALCPQDCQVAQTLKISDDVCQNPNPRRAVVSEELLNWQNWLPDGSFEQGITEGIVVDFPQSALIYGKAERSQLAAHTGLWGYVISTSIDEGLVFSIKFFMEKGERTRFSFWARSVKGEVLLNPKILGVNFDSSNKPNPIFTSKNSFTIEEEWTEVSFESNFDHAYDYAFLSLDIPPNTSLYIDDIAIEFPQWKTVTYSGPHQNVGGIAVPTEPLAPVHINFLIHIEDPSLIQANEKYFQTKTAVFKELARIFHEHNGFLMIQPEEDWVMAAKRFDANLLQELVKDYNVSFSTHTHGPHCRDDQGRLRSYSDCNENINSSGWDQSINDYEYPYVVEYVRNLRDLITAASGVPVTDHNGNWEFDQASSFSEIPMTTWSAYKNWETQETYDYLINNPWRPTQVNADEDIEAFLTHDLNTQIVYIPGWGQVISRHPERLLERIRPMLSQFIYYADPQRVNSFYVVFHVDHFYSRSGDSNYINYDLTSETLSYSDEFKQHLAFWDEMLTDTIDPLVEQGYLQWTSLPEIGNLYQEWETSCGVIDKVTAPSEAPAKTSTSTTDYEPPINIALILHIDPSVAPEENIFKPTSDIYNRSYTEIEWLIEEASRHNIHFTALYNGWFTKWAIEQNDLSQFEDLIAAGHEIGSHAHRITFDSTEDAWMMHLDKLSRYGIPNYDSDLASQAWADADQFMDALLQKLGVLDQNQTMCAVPLKCSDEGQLMTKYGFLIASGNRSEKGTAYIGHTVWNPWRPASVDHLGYELEEDLNAPFLAIDHYAQIGSAEAHGMDLSVPQLQRHFLILYAEWLSRIRKGVEDKVWNFGFVYHPNQGDKYNNDLKEFLDWLDKYFIEKTTPEGYPIARYATVAEIGKEYLDWEKNHPGSSSFNYVKDDPYPYTYAVLAQKLENAAYEETLDLEAGVTVFRFSIDGEDIYLIWSNTGEHVIDFSSILSGQLTLTDVQGRTSVQDATSITLGEDPLLIEK